MTEWENFDQALSNIEDIFEYNSIIERKVLDLLKTIFPNSKFQLYQELFQKYFYDFSIEMTDFRLYCEVKQEKYSLKRFWKNYIPLISEEINKLNIKQKKKKVKYLLVLIDSEDSVEKMHISPIYDDILIINIKMLFSFQDLESYLAEDIKTFIKNIFKEASGVLYDSFIFNTINIIKDLDEPAKIFNLDEFYINSDILKLEFKKIFNESIKLFSKNEIDLLNKFLMSYYSFYPREYPLAFRKNSNSAEKIQRVLSESNNVIYFHQLEEIGFNIKEINSLINLLNSIHLNFKFYNIKECQISILISVNNLNKTLFNDYIINPILKEGFKIQTFTYRSNLDDILKTSSKSNITIIDLIELDPKAFYYLGRIQNYPTKLILLISEEEKIPDILKNERFLIYGENNLELESIKENLLKLINQICVDYLS